jgi:hypothetical protein
VSDDEKEPVEQGNLRLTTLVFGKGLLGTDGFNTALLGEGGIDLHNLFQRASGEIVFPAHLALNPSSRSTTIRRAENGG